MPRRPGHWVATRDLRGEQGVNGRYLLARNLLGNGKTNRTAGHHVNVADSRPSMNSVDKPRYLVWNFVRYLAKMLVDIP